MQFCHTLVVYEILELFTILFSPFKDYKSYGICPKILNTKVSDKMTYANSADPDQTAPEGAV